MTLLTFNLELWNWSLTKQKVKNRKKLENMTGKVESWKSSKEANKCEAGGIVVELYEIVAIWNFSVGS